MSINKDHKIRIRGLRQHNLKNLDLDLPLHRLIAISGVSGSGKSSLALHALYAEGQRRYVETFSPYARQFLERMDPPQADLIEGIPPSIAIESGTAVRSSRSTVGTITEINDHLKLLFARLSVPHCPQCGEAVFQDTPESVYERLSDLPLESRLLIVFSFARGTDLTWSQVLISQGFLRLYRDGKVVDIETLADSGLEQIGKGELVVVVDRIHWKKAPRERVIDSLRTAFLHGNGRAGVIVLPDEERWFSSDLACATCRPSVALPQPVPNLFSFNSPLGACPECRGFGRSIGVDLDLVIPDRRRSLREGAIKPWGTDRLEYEDLLAFCGREGISLDTPFELLDDDAKRRVIEGSGSFYGIKGFFDWLETKTYRMHVRVFLSRYRSYTACRSCGGTRYQPGTNLYRLHGVTLGTLCSWSIEACLEFFSQRWPEADQDAAAALLLSEIRNRLQFLRSVGLDYLSLDRQSRTLSGGEVQRVHLTRALGSALVNVLYVLDEPSVGLHARDQQRLMGQLRRLVEAGNSVVVVEHDPDMIRFCDEVIDMGPGGGERGGNVIYQGPPGDLPQCQASLTGAYLARRWNGVSTGREFSDKRRCLVVKEARENNLKSITVSFPLGLLVGVSGVSGSGKSTLVEKTLYYNWLRQTGKATDSPGLCNGLDGVDLVSEMVLVDQQPIGRTPRANLLTYTRALDPMRQILARTPEAIARGFSTGHFSFNVPGGRCELCKGEGYERVEMQFLADVYLRCPQCGGRRFKDEILEIRARGVSIGDMLELTAQELLDTFGDCEPLVRALRPAVEIGLDYLRLGQPLSSLSGGEAQRLKLIRFLASDKGKAGRNSKHRVFLLDEPTTGLHPHDLGKLLEVLQRLVNMGNTVVVVEHNLDLLRVCDWLIDLGPEGGEKGGNIVAEGPPESVAAHLESHTGRFLRERLHVGRGFRPEAEMEHDPSFKRMESEKHVFEPSGSIVIRGAREHNLQIAEISLQRDEMIVITGLSGSGKSTLAFDVLFAEGQRRYLESLSSYVRQYFKILEKPEVDQILGLPPTIAIEQRTSQLNRRSTVATITEIFHFLRLLFAKLGVQHCPDCGRKLGALTYDQILSLVKDLHRGERFKILAPLVRGRKGIYRDLFTRLHRMGFQTARVDGKWLRLDPTPVLERHREHDIEVVIADTSAGKLSEKELGEAVRKALGLGGGALHVLGKERRVFSQHLYCPRCQHGLAPLDPRLFSFNSRHGACVACGGIGTTRRLNVERIAGPPELPLKDGLVRFLRTADFRGLLRSSAKKLERYWVDGLGVDLEEPFGRNDEQVKETMLYGKEGKFKGLLSLLEQVTEEDRGWKDMEPFLEDVPCNECGGQRLNRQARSVQLKGWTIGELTHLNVAAFREQWISLHFDPEETPIVSPVSKEILDRLTFLERVGLGYLSLDRSGDTLSGGETQRIRLAAQLGSNLRGVCYILDEPTIGLHPADNAKLLDGLRRLRDKGNTIVVVEHDADTMKNADTLIELGPDAGRGGGKLVAQGSFNALCKDPKTLTGQWFGKPLHELFPMLTKASAGEKGWLEIRGARARNLKDLNVRIPIGTLTCVTGVSGAGKSTLVQEVLYGGLQERLGKQYVGHNPSLEGMEGFEVFHRVLEVDHNPIGRTPRSIPATYVGVWDEIRKLFASLPESKVRGFSPGRFSFNVKGGRCEACKGHGEAKVEMHFLPDVYVPCDSCGGNRFNSETLAIKFKGRNIAEILTMTIEEAAPFFDVFHRIARPLAILCDLGLGYLTLGQPSPSLSGGEAQRIKLASELGNHRGATLYILDEPTTGLHRADVKKLLDVLQALRDHGHTVVVVEHNMDFIWACDYVVDLGPGSGEEGGRIVAEGIPFDLLEKAGSSATARALLGYRDSKGETCGS